MEKILVTGGAGFIGSHLCEKLNSLNIYEVVSLDNYFTGSYKNHIKGVNYITGNSTDVNELIKFKPDYVYHLGEYSRVEQSFEDIEILRFISYKHFIWIIIIPPIASFCYQLDGIFIGASQTKEIRNAMIFSVIGFIGASIYLIDYFENHGLWFSLMFFMILRALTLKFYFNKILRKF